jgi:hypothetical protein
MSHDNKMKLRDAVASVLAAVRPYNNPIKLSGLVIAEMYGPDGELKSRVATCNLVTAVGDQMYAARGAGIGSPPNAPTGMKLGTGSTAVAKTGAGAALVTYLSGSQHAFDATYPQASGGVATYKVTWAAGEATTASAITEAVIVNETLSNATSTAANTASRVIISGVGSKGALDTLTITWTHTLLGA